MLVLSDGRVQVHGATAVAMDHLDLQPDGGRFEAGVLLTGRVLSHDARLHLTRVDVAGQVFTLPLLERLPPGEPVRVRVRARDVALAVQEPVGLSIRNIVPGTVGEVTVGDHGVADVQVAFPGGHLRARVTLAAVEQLALREGMPVYALVKSVAFERML
jgi:molybdate transport system ATP-binding protein